MTRTTELSIDPRRLISTVLIACVGFEILLVFLDYRVNYSRLTDIGAIRRLFNITREDSLASWFGTTQTLLVALTLWLIFWVVKNGSGPRWRTIGWGFLALLFSYMALDDGALIHERLGTTFGVLAGNDPAGGVSMRARLLEVFPSYAWQILFVPLFGAAGVFMAVFLWRELKEKRARAVVGVALACFALAVGLDFFEGLEEEHDWNVYASIAATYELDVFTARKFRQRPYETLVHFSKSIEEFLEMLGTTLLWVVFLGYLTRIGGNLRIRCETDNTRVRRPSPTETNGDPKNSN